MARRLRGSSPPSAASTAQVRSLGYPEAEGGARLTAVGAAEGGLLLLRGRAHEVADGRHAASLLGVGGSPGRSTVFLHGVILLCVCTWAVLRLLLADGGWHGGSAGAVLPPRLRLLRFALWGTRRQRGALA